MEKKKADKKKLESGDAHRIAYCENCWMKKWAGSGVYTCPSAYGTCVRKDGIKEW